MHGLRARLTARVTLRYFLLQLPGWLAGGLAVVVALRLFDVTPWIGWTAFGVWIAKDFLLFPFIWRGYVPDAPSAGDALIGARALVRERLAPRGYVDVAGELWQAEPLEQGRAVEPGTLVRVVGVRGLTLVVTEQMTPVPSDRG